MEKLKQLTVLLMISILAVTSVYAVYKYTTFTGTITWKVTDTSFVVTNETGVQLPSTWTYDLGIVQNNTKHHFNFNITNIGNVKINVNVTNEISTNCTVSWTSKSLTLDIGESKWMNLTLTITGDGQYQFSFKSSKA